MKGLLIGLGAVLVIGVGIAVLKNDTAPQQAAVKSATTSNRYDSVLSDIRAGAALLDVRTPEEYATGHFEGATNLPLQDIQSGAYPVGDTNKKIYVYCRSGNRSAQATTALKQAGFTNIIDLGGLANVQALGGTLQK